MSDRYAVFGNPVGHSLSPRIHALFAAATGEALTYEAVEIPLGGFSAAARAFFASGGGGLNVTVPFKEEALRFTDRLTERARRAGAVNTLARQGDGAVLGDNTDGAGFLRDLTENLGWPVAGRRVLLLGAGGAARGVLAPLLAAGPAELVVANRTAARARALAAAFADLGPVEGVGWEALAGRRFDLVIQATSAGLTGALPPLPEGLLSPGAHCYDLRYGAAAVPFLRWAATQGAAAAADGLGMLVEQAAESFALWRGVRPSTGPVLQALRRELSEKLAQ